MIAKLADAYIQHQITILLTQIYFNPSVHK